MDTQERKELLKAIEHLLYHNLYDDLDIVQAAYVREGLAIIRKYMVLPIYLEKEFFPNG
jgi:hypothetical protein